LDLMQTVERTALRRSAARPSLLSDALVRDLIAAGHVDVIVGLPTLDNASSVSGVVHAVHHAFGAQLARDRTMLLNADGGSTDGTTDIVRGETRNPSELLTAVHTLRTVHRVIAPYHGVPGRGGALRIVFAAADLLRARAVGIVDPDATALTAQDVANLVEPILRRGYDFVKPVTAHSPWEAPLVTQLVRPLMRAAYGKRLREPLATQFACSGRFAIEALASGGWDEPFAQYGVDVWLTARAMGGGAKLAQVVTRGAADPRRVYQPPLEDVFAQVVGAVVACLEADAEHWLSVNGSEDVPVIGGSLSPSSARPPFDVARFASVFAQGMRDLGPILESVLSTETRRGLERVAAESSPPRVPDELWVRAVHDAIVAVHRHLLPTAQIVQALFPIYLGRVASFLAETASLDVDAAFSRHEALACAFERAKPEVASLWASQT
jgi:hypothetical protein